jgi:hypothetical protein
MFVYASGGSDGQPEQDTERNQEKAAAIVNEEFSPKTSMNTGLVRRRKSKGE